MEAAEYAAMDRLEQDMWWYQGLHRLLGAVLGRFAPTGAAATLDAGCGTGGLLRWLASGGPERRLIGVEFAAPAAALAKAKSGCPVAVGSVNALPLAGGSIQAVVSADVLCHARVHPTEALAEAHRVLAPGGVLVANLPAYEWMKSAHDARVHNVRRFARGQALAALRQAGFTPLWSSYWNSFLFPVMVVRRVLARSGEGASDVRAYAGWINRLLGFILAVERRLILGGLRMPFGGSLLVVARKNG